MSSSSAIRGGRAFVELFGDDTKLVKSLRSAEKKLKAWGANISAVGKKVALAGTALLTPLVAATKVFADMGASLSNVSQRTGVAASALSELKYAAEMSGTSLETVEGALTKMQVKLIEAQNGSDSAAAGFQSLGISVEKLAKLNPEQQFLAVADAVGRIANPAQRAKAAMEVFGKSGVQLLPMLGDGAASLETLRQRARDLGITMSDEAAGQAADFGNVLSELWMVLKSSAVQLGAAVVPALKEFIGSLTTGLVAVVNWIRENQEMIRLAFYVAAGILAAGAAIYAGGAALSALGAIAGGVATAITSIGAAIGFLLSPIGLVVAGLAGLTAWFVTSTETGAATLDWLGGVFGELKDDALSAFDGISDALASGNIALAGKILWALLKMEWQKGINWINSKWQAWKAFFLEVFNAAVYGLASLFTKIWGGIQIAWLEGTNFLKNAWTNFTSFLKQTWNSFKGFMSKAWAKIKETFGGDDAEAEIQRINAETLAEEQRLEAERAAIVNGRNSEADKKRKQIETEEKQSLQALGQMHAAENKKIAENQQKSLDESAQAVAEAKKEFAEAVGEAKEGRIAHDKAKREGPAKPKLPTAAELEGVEKDLTGKGKSTGTFSAAAAARIGGGNIADKQLKATEAITTAVNGVKGAVVGITEGFKWKD